MNTRNTAALSIAQAIALLEPPRAAMQKEIAARFPAGKIVAAGDDEALLSEFIAGVNLELGEEVFVQERLVALSAAGHSEWYGKIWSALPIAVIWAGIRRYSGAGRCSLKVKVGEREIDVSAATPEEAERLFNLAAGVIIYRIEDPPANTPPPES